jgi:chromosome segregation ATPase
MSSEPVSSLPPLSPGKSDVSPSPSESDPPVNVIQYYPRVRQLELDVGSLQQQVPLSVSKTMAGLKQTVRLLQGSGGGASVADVQRELNEDLDVEIERAINFLHKKVVDVPEPPAPESRGLDSRFNNVREWAQREQAATDQRISWLERRFAKFARKVPIVEEKSELEMLEEQLNEQTRAIQELTQRLAEIEGSVEPVPPQPRESEEGEEESATKQEVVVPDLTQPFRVLSQKVATFRGAFRRRLAAVREKVTSTSQKVADLNEVLGEIQEGTRELEAQVFEIGHLSESLAKQLDELNRGIATAPRDAQLILSLSAQIQLAHEGMTNELQFIQQQIRQYENSLPLFDL